jgi:polyhydroxybutyrate depolymerase
MRIKLISLVAIAIAMLVNIPAEVAAADLVRTISVDGRTRSFTVFIPDRVLAARRPVPAVFLLHGGGGTGGQVRKHLGFDAVAEREGIIAVYPDGLNRGWNDGRTDLQKRRGVAPDDVAFLTRVARSIKEEMLALAGQTYVVGVSNGGMMAFRLACDAAGEFDGMATIIANLGSELAAVCKPFRPMPVMAIQATDDPLVPWAGGGVGFLGKRGHVLSADATVAFWGKLLGCDTAPSTTELPHRLAADATRARHETYTCKASRLERIIIVGGGHQVPRLVSSTRLIDTLLGPANSDFEAGEMAWRFLSGRNPR